MKGAGMLIVSLRVFWAKHHYILLFAVVLYTCNHTVISAVCRKHNEKLLNLSDDSVRRAG